MRPLGIPVTLDRPRTLPLNEQALHICRHTFCVALEPAAFLQAELTLELTRDLIWSGCVIEGGRLTWEMVCRMVTLDNFTTFHDPIAKALLRGIGSAYQPN